MSIKAKTFQNLLGRPLNTHNFFVLIPTMSYVELLVSATSFPTEKLGSKVLYYQGEPTYFPTMPQRGGTWQCTLSEGEYAKVYGSASMEYKTNFLQSLGLLNSWSLLDSFDIEVGSKAISAGVTATQAEVPFSVKLLDCFLLGMEPVQLSAGQTTLSWAWQVSFQYGSLEYSASGALSKKLSDLTSGIIGDRYRPSQDGVVSLPPLPNISELLVGANELSKQAKS